MSQAVALTTIGWAMLVSGCGNDSDADDDANAAEETTICLLESDSDAPDFSPSLGCNDDFLALASVPADASIPGARSVKTVVDRIDSDALYFQNSQKYPIHWEFVSEHLSGGDLPIVPMLSSFNTTEYYSPSRRFILGALTHYEGPDKYCYEIAPYDSAALELIETAYESIKAATHLRDDLCFHPTSQAVESAVADSDFNIVTTDELFADIDYQPLNFAETFGRLTFSTAAALETEYVTFRDIVVLDSVPNDISVTMGIITAEFQTPLSHINVLAQNRGIPNMGLRDAFDDQTLRELDGKWVRLRVGPNDYELEEVEKEEADLWWEENKPSEVQVPGINLEATDLRDIQQAIDIDANDGDLLAAIKEGTRAFGGKAANYASLAMIEDVPSPKAFAVPIFYYWQFMEENGFDVRVEEMLADETFQDSAEQRDIELAALRAAMEEAPVNADFEAMLLDKLESDYPGVRMRFRSSTNAEDLDGFTGAGLYTSRSGDPSDPDAPVLDAIRTVWASVWFFRAFEERSFRSIDHTAVGMALLVHRSFPDEEANGVALTNNPFDQSNIEPAFYVNVQLGEASVVHPFPGVTTDQYLHYFDLPGQPLSYVSSSNLIEPDQTVLSGAQSHQLGLALDAIQDHFAPAYSPGDGSWWAMDVEFKFDGEPGEEPQLFVKQARPYGN